MNRVYLPFRIPSLAFLILNLTLGFAQSQSQSETREAMPHADLLVIVGAPGTPEYATAFAEAARNWEAAGAAGGVRTKVIGLPDKSPPEGGALSQIESAIKAAEPDEERPLWLVLLGHGTWDGESAKLALTGPDLSASHVQEMLGGLRRPVFLIDCTSASAPFLRTLSGTNRIIITATQSPGETNFARFGLEMARSLTSPDSDLDGDGQRSLLELFLHASRVTADFYKNDNRLATEHPLLDDNGDGRGTPPEAYEGISPTAKALETEASKNVPLDGSSARQWCLQWNPEEQTLTPAQRTTRNALETKLEALKALRPTLTDDAYFRQLEPILQELGKIYPQ